MRRWTSKTPIRSIAALATSLSLAACAGVGGVEDEEVYATPDGVVVVDTTDVVATVTAVDPIKGTVKLTDPTGHSSTLKAAKGIDVSNFKVGDVIGIEVTEAVAVSIQQDGVAAAPTGGALLATAGDDKEQVTFSGEVVTVSALVTAVDAAHRKVTLQMPDGTQKTVKAPKGFDLSTVAPGATINATYVEEVIVDTVKR